jgi:hypothetical protein
MSEPMSLQQISDRFAICDLLARYTRAIDTGQWDLLDTVFTADATIDYTATGGTKGDLPAVKTWLSQVLPHWPGRQHKLGQITVTFEDGAGTAGSGARSGGGPETATVVAAFTDMLAPSREMIPADTAGLIEGGGWYHHLVVRTADGWRSRELVEEQAWRTMR